MLSHILVNFFPASVNNTEYNWVAFLGWLILLINVVLVGLCSLRNWRKTINNMWHLFCDWGSTLQRDRMTRRLELNEVFSVSLYRQPI